jgi:hypothetical protein
MVAGYGDTIHRNSPADAGRTWSKASAVVWQPEQPRARGEDAQIIAPLVLVNGTAPRTRGGHLLTWAFSRRSTTSASLPPNAPHR